MSRIELLNPNPQGKIRWTEEAARLWLRQHNIEFKAFIQDHYTYESLRDAYEKYYFKEPYLGVDKTLDHSTPNFTKILILKELLFNTKFGQFLFLGAQQSGKTALMFIISEWLHNIGRKIAWLGPPANLPEFVDISTADYYEIPQEYVLIVDEGALRFGQRDAMSKESKEFFQNIPIISHKKQILLFSSQSLALTDVYTTHLVKAMFLKMMTEAQIYGERSLVKTVSEWVPHTFEKDLTYIRWEGPKPLNFTVRIPLPPWWNSDFSTPYAKLEEGDAVKYAAELFAKWSGEPDCLKRISIELQRKGFKKPIQWWKEKLEVE